MKRSPLNRRTPIKRQSPRGKAKAARMAKAKKLLLRLRGARCERCEAEKRPAALDPHHKRYASQGGDESPENLVLLCRRCHDAIHWHTAEDWRRWVA